MRLTRKWPNCFSLVTSVYVEQQEYDMASKADGFLAWYNTVLPLPPECPACGRRHET